MPEDLHGDQLAIGYSPVTRQKTREPLNFFDAKGVNAAAGFSSNVLDLLDFAAWQFRLYESDEADILKPSTLKNMHNIHWMDTDFGTSWGLGFAVRKWLDNERWVGHGGYCPGYQSSLQLNPQKKMAYSVMINANGVNPTSYVKGMHELLSMTKGEEVPEDADHSEFRGFYTMDILGEFYLDQVGEHLVRMGIPTDDPAGSITKFKKVEDDVFRRVRDNGELGEYLNFERDADGEIVRVKSFSNYVFDKQD
jgi:CubicO group peptidase (beta-lactamase class C family)